MTNKSEKVLESWLRMTTIINNEKITSDLPFNESMICRYLYQHKDEFVTATDLCASMRMKKSQMNRTLNNMEKKKLIHRKRNDEDQRQVFILLNEEMIVAYHQQHEKVLRLVDGIFDKMGPEKMDEVIELFDLVSKTALETL